MKLLISCVLGISFSIPNTALFVSFALGYTAYEPALWIAIVEAGTSLGLVLWFAYVLISYIRELNKEG